MDLIQFCQSCSIPLDQPSLQGTEEDGRLSTDYCKYCYQQGKFTDGANTIEEMRSAIISRMGSENIPEDLIASATARLSGLKRWKKKKQVKRTPPVAAIPQTSPEMHPLETPPPPGELAISEEDLGLVSGEQTHSQDPVDSMNNG